MNKFKVSATAFLTTFTFTTFAQSMGIISDITPQERVSNHYQDLQQLSAQHQTSWVDTIAYPPALYSSNTLLFALSQPVYLTADQVDYLVHAVRFPANSSKQTRAEPDFCWKLQVRPTPEQIAHVMTIAEIGYWPDEAMLTSHPKYEQNLEHLFFEVQEVLGITHTAEQYPNTTTLLQSAMVDMRLMAFAVKYHLLHASTYQLETDLEPIKRIKSPSFASGRTRWAYVQAYMLAELTPERAVSLLIWLMK